MDSVVAESAAVFELMAGEDQTLFVREDALLLLDLGLDIVDGVRRLATDDDSLAGEGPDENLQHCRVWCREEDRN